MRNALTVFATLFCLSLFAATPARAQETPQPTVYTYVSFWGVPRAHWGAMETFLESEQSAFDKLVDAGTLTGYGTCIYELHSVDGFTHCTWFQASSVGNILRALNALSASAASSPVLADTRHMDELYQSTMYGGHPGVYHNAYMWFGHFTLKRGGVGPWSHLFGIYVRPELDKMVASGEVAGYQLLTPLVHTPGSSGTLDYEFISTSPDGIDQFFTAVGKIESANPAIPAAISSYENPAGHYDVILKIPVAREK